MAWRSAAEIIWEASGVALGWLILSNGGSIVAFVGIAVIFSNTIEALVNMAYFAFVAPIRITIRLASLRLVFFGGLPFLMWIVLQTFYQQTSSLALGQLGGVVAVGWYGVANQFLAPLYSIPGVVIIVLLPHFSQIQILSEARFKETVSRTLNYIILITLPTAMGLTALAGRVIEIFNYPPAFQHSIPVLRLLALSLPFTSVTMIIAIGVSAMKKERMWAYVSFLSLVALFVLNVILVPLARDLLDNAAIGAAAALLGAELVTVGAAWLLFGRSMIDRSFTITLAKAIIAGAVMVVVVLSVAWLPIPVPIAVGAVTYAGLILVFKALPEDDTRTLWMALVRRG